ncbi:MAG: hypothetical protein HFACDABA_01104 [Anaerolineales bacterium]|nr:hypothetical protein [Anaerolineales bacterium]
MPQTMNWKIVGLFLVSALLLFFGFDRNLWRLSPAENFSSFQQDSESLVLGRLVQSRQAGLFSEGALLGWGDAASPDLTAEDYDHQYDVYLSDGGFDSYMIYKSQSGMQAAFFGLLDWGSPFSSARNLRLFHAFTALMSALTISALVTWFYLEFGWVTAITVLATTLGSMWVTYYGRNLFYSIWTYFLPMAILLHLLRRESLGGILRERNLYAAMCGLIFFKGIFSGYDFLLPPLGMLAVALIFYAVKDSWSFGKSARRITLTAAFSSAGILLSFLVVAAQIGAVSGSFADGLLHLANTIGRRTVGETLNPAQSGIYELAGAASLGSVLDTLLHKSAILVGIKYIHLIYVFLAATVLFLAVPRLRKGTRSDIALLVTTWVSILSPLSWIVLFKAHAAFHSHTTSIIWHMPFVIFGYALVGRLLAGVFRGR